MTARPHRPVDASTGGRANPGNATSRLGRYEITGRLATGGMATVYLARLEAAGGFSREFALKVVHPHLTEDPGFRRRFVRETTVASRVRHPNAITTIDAGEDHGYSYLVLELIDGVTLRQLLLHLSRPMAPPLAALIIAMVARGLHALHTVRGEDGEPMGVVHRDLSPQNVMVERSGRVVLIDLGLAKVEHDKEATQVGVLVGKLPYMSPEQARLDPLDARSDVFSLGTVAYELCTGMLPFGDAHTTSTLDKLQSCDPDEIASGLEVHHVPAWFASIIGCCLQPRPRDRFDSAHDLAETVLQALREAGHDETSLRRELAHLVAASGPEMIKVHRADPLPPRIDLAPTREPHAGRWVALGAAGALAMLLGLHLSTEVRDSTSEPADEAVLSIGGPESRGELETSRSPRETAAGSPGDAPASEQAPASEDLEAADETDTSTTPKRKPRVRRAPELRPNPYAE
jgi:eukaryotic-like serine/threonine-protein kinase